MGVSLKKQLKKLERQIRDLRGREPDQSEGNGNRQGHPEIVIHTINGDTQLAWRNPSVNQTVLRTEQVAPGFKHVAEAVVNILERLPAPSLSKEDQQEVAAAAEDVFEEVTESEPNRGRTRRALQRLKGILGPIAVGASKGAAGGAEEWAKKAIEQLHTLALPS
jgi:hypothetical protein